MNVQENMLERVCVRCGCKSLIDLRPMETFAVLGAIELIVIDHADVDLVYEKHLLERVLVGLVGIFWL